MFHFGAEAGGPVVGRAVPGVSTSPSVWGGERENEAVLSASAQRNTHTISSQHGDFRTLCRLVH